MLYKVLVVDDDTSICDMLVLSLKNTCFDIRVVNNAYQAIEWIEADCPDLILLDWMMPDMSGIRLSEVIRCNTDTGHIPIILMTARSSEDDKVRGFEAGADDYMTKPFSMRELKARMMALLRRTTQSATQTPANVIIIDKLILNIDSHRLTVDGEQLKLGPTEYRLLQLFMSNPEQAYHRKQLIEAAWDHRSYVDERTVDVHIRRLRKALSGYGLAHYIQTVRTVGYRFSAK